MNVALELIKFAPKKKIECNEIWKKTNFQILGVFRGSLTGAVRERTFLDRI